MGIAKGSDVRPGVPPVSLGLRRFCVAGHYYYYYYYYYHDYYYYYYYSCYYYYYY